MAESVTLLAESVEKLINGKNEKPQAPEKIGVTGEQTGEPKTTKGNENAGTIQGEGVSASDKKSDTGGRANRGSTGESVDVGLAADNKGTDTEDAVSDSVQGSGGTGKGDAGGTEPALSTPDGQGNTGNGGTESKPPISGLEHEITDEDNIGSGGLVKKFNDNVAAIKILKLLDKESRTATPDERKALARYVGFGALKGVFDHRNKQWTKQYKELKELLTEEEYDSTRAPILNAHYTSKTVVA